jgi:ankyrin repeat protein
MKFPAGTVAYRKKLMALSGALFGSTATMSALAQTLAELDGISTLLESIRAKAETTATKARVALETMAVSLEDEEGEFTEPKELKELKAMEIDVNEIERLRLNDRLVTKLIDKNTLNDLFVRSLHDTELFILLLTFVDPSFQDNIAIRNASQRGHVAVVDRLLQDERVDPSANDNEPIRVASEKGFVAVVDRLLADERVDPSANENEAIRWASHCGHLAVVERLLADSRVNPSACDNYAIRWASYYGNLAEVERLLADPRVDPSANDNYAIKWASENGHVAVVELLKAHGCVLPAA